MMMPFALSALVAFLAAYLIGAFPTGVVATRLAGAPDVRYHGSGHTGGTNTARMAGPKIGVAVVLIDGLKGLLAWLVAALITQGSIWALPLAAVGAVLGHCWPIYTGFKGGMGLATGGMILLVTAPLTTLMLVGLWAGLYFGIFRRRYSVRSVILACVLVGGVSLGFLPKSLAVNWTLALICVVIVLRHLPQWGRVR